MNIKSLYYVIFIMLVAVWTIALIFNIFSFNDVQFIHIAPSIVLLIGVVAFKKIINKNNNDWFSIDMIFLFIFYLFHFGYLYLYFFGFDEYDKEVFWNNSVMEIAIYFTTLCVCFYMLGFSLISPITQHKLLTMNVENNSTIHKYSKLLLLVCLMMFWLPILTIISSAFTDYKVLISVGEKSPIGKLYWVGQYLAVAALGIYYLTKKYVYNKFLSGWADYAAILYIFGYFFIGDRGGFLFYSVIPLVAYSAFYKKIKIKKFSFYLLLILSISSVIAVSRTQSVYNPIDAVDLYGDNKKINPIVDAVSEFGRSFKTVPIAMTYIPEQYDYWYGKSYYDALALTVPNFFGSRTSSSVANWLTETVFGKDAYGRGGSIVMESYANFGIVVSLFFFIILGCFSGFLYKRFQVSNSIYYSLLYIALIACLALWMRNSSAIVFRTIIWSIVICGVFILVSRQAQRSSQ